MPPERPTVGALVLGHLTSTGTAQSALASGTGLSRSYVNHMLAGRKVAPPEWLDLVASTLRLTPEQRRDLMAAGAAQAGYDLDLSQP